MPRDGQGNFTRTNGVFNGPNTWDDQANSADNFINSQRADTHDQDIADGLTGSLPRNGEAGMTGNLPMGNNRITGLADATTRSDATTLAQMQDGGSLFAVDSGAADAYVAAFTPTIPALVDGMRIWVEISNTNTGASTLDVNSIGAKDIKLMNGADPIANQLVAGRIYGFIYDATADDFFLPNPSIPLFYSDDAGSAAGPIIPRHRNSSTPAANDDLAEDRWQGQDSGGNKHTYATLRAKIVDPTDGSEDGLLELEARSGLDFTSASAGVTCGGVIMPRGFINGFKMVNAADAAHDIRLEAGQAADSTNKAIIQRTAQIIKRIDQIWVAGTNAGGFPSTLTGGVPQANETYHFFAIRNPSNGNVDAGYDESLTATKLLADAVGFTQYRYVGSVIVDGSANIIPFRQKEDEFLLNVPVSDYNLSNPGTTATLRPLSVPDRVEVWAKHSIAFQHGGVGSAVSLLVTSPDQADTAPSDTIFTLRSDTDSVTAKEVSGQIEIRTDTSRQIRTRFGATGANLDVQGVTHGWIDPRGKG